MVEDPADDDGQAGKCDEDGGHAGELKETMSLRFKRLHENNWNLCGRRPEAISKFGF